MKKYLSILALSLCAVLALTSCGSAPAQKRSLEWKADYLTTLKKAQTLAKNYDLKSKIYNHETDDGKVYADDVLFYAFNEDRSEQIVFMQENHKKYNYIFSYVELQGSCTSDITVDLGNGTKISLKNSDSLARINRSDARLLKRQEWTDHLDKDRIYFRTTLQKTLGTEFREQITLVQK